MPVPAVSETFAERTARVWSSDIRPTLSLGLPLAGAQLAQIAINATDVLMIGRLGAEKLAASVLAFNLYMLMWFFGMGIIQAVIPLAAQARGRRDLRQLRRVVRMGLWVAFLYCVPALVVLHFAEEVLVFLGQDPALAELAGGYMDWLKWTIVPGLVMFALRAFLTVMEKSQVVLFATITGALANAVFDYLLIFGEFGFPKLELVGAGIASVGSSMATLLFLFVYTIRHSHLRRYSLFGRLWRPDLQVLVQILKLGLPIAVTIVAEGGLFTASSILIGWLGTLPLAAHGIALQIASITFMVPLGISQAALTRVGLAAGRQDLGGVGRAGWSALAVAELFMLLCAITFWVFPETLISFYLDFSNPQSQEVLSLAVTFLAVAAIFQIADGAQAIGTNILRGLGDTTLPLIYALGGYWIIGIGLSLGLGFGAGWGGAGVWSGLAGGLATVGALTLIRFYRREELGLIKAAPAER